MRILNYVLLVTGFCSLLSCKDDNTIAPSDDTKTGSVKMEFQNYVGDKPMELSGLSNYENENGDDFKVTLFKYYVSNVVLVNKDGTTIFVEPESYHLINQDDNTSLSFELSSVPAGTYSSVRLMFGVDSLHNVSGAQTGALDPANGMFWTWSTGYIMAKMEGTSSKVGSSGGALSFHLGGFSGTYKAIKTLELAFPKDMEVTESNQSGITIKADVLAWFKSPNLIDFSVLNSIGSIDETSGKMSDNAHNMFSVTEIK